MPSCTPNALGVPYLRSVGTVCPRLSLGSGQGHSEKAKLKWIVVASQPPIAAAAAAAAAAAVVAVVAVVVAVVAATAADTGARKFVEEFEGG